MRVNFGKWAVLWLLFAVLTSGCVIEQGSGNTPQEAQSQAQEVNSTVYVDTDASRAESLGLIFGMPPIDDRLDVPQGDREDWRYILVTENGDLKIELNVDNANIAGGWSIIDDKGRTLHTQSFVPAQSFYEFSRPLRKGIYFFRIYATSGQSIYTIASSFSFSAVEPLPMEPKEVVVEKAVDKPKPKPRKHGHKKPKPKPSSKGASKGSKKLEGYITSITPRKDGLSDVVIRGFGKTKGVQSGMRGTLKAFKGVLVKIKKCYPTSCRGTLSEHVDERELKKKSDVIIYVD